MNKLQMHHPFYEFIAHALNTCISEQKTKHEPLALFSAGEKPEISLADYLARIVQYAPINDEILVVAVIYVDRMATQCQAPILNPFNVHRLFLASLLVAIKFYSDTFYSNSYFASVGGIPTGELNALERLLLKTLNFELVVSSEDFSLFHSKLISRQPIQMPLQLRKSTASARPIPTNQKVEFSKASPGKCSISPERRDSSLIQMEQTRNHSRTVSLYNSGEVPSIKEVDDETEKISLRLDYPDLDSLKANTKHQLSRSLHNFQTESKTSPLRPIQSNNRHSVGDTLLSAADSIKANQGTKKQATKRQRTISTDGDWSIPRSKTQPDYYPIRTFQAQNRYQQSHYMSAYDTDHFKENRTMRNRTSGSSLNIERSIYDNTSNQLEKALSFFEDDSDSDSSMETPMRVESLYDTCKTASPADLEQQLIERARLAST